MTTYLSDLEPLQDILDTLVFEEYEEPSIFTEEYAVDLVETALHLMDEYMKENYPGWSWNDLIPKLVRLNLISTTEHPGDTKLWQGLWLKAGINEIAVSKVGKTVMFEAVLE